MDFRELSYVLAIAKYQNITKAADALYITQPTLTKFLQSLESQMGQKLFRKLGRRFVLTYAGERYVARATEILNLKKELDQEMNDIIKNNHGAGLIFPADNFRFRQLKRKRGGELPPNAAEDWLDVQARALRRAAQYVIGTYDLAANGQYLIREGARV